MSDATQLDRIAVVLVASRNPLNIGAAARAMSNFGFTDLRVVNPYDLAFREARSAVGAASLLANARECKSTAEAVADCTLVVGTTAATARDPQQPLLPLQQGAAEIQKQSAAGRIALLFGSEKRGLSNQDMSHCHWLMRIPTREEHGSMNLGQAVAVCLYELIRARNAVSSPPEQPRPASAAAQERIASVLLQALQESGYFNPATVADAEARVRRLVRRLAISEADAEVWLGMLRQILWKIRAGSGK